MLIRQVKSLRTYTTRPFKYMQTKRSLRCVCEFGTRLVVVVKQYLLGRLNLESVIDQPGDEKHR